MALLRFASVLVLAIWVGGLATLGGLAAPEIFTVLERHDPARGRVLAGEVFGAVFQRFQRTTWVLGAVLLALYGSRALLGPRPRRLGLRVWMATGLLAMSLVGFLVESDFFLDRTVAVLGRFFEHRGAQPGIGVRRVLVDDIDRG